MAPAHMVQGSSVTQRSHPSKLVIAARHHRRAKRQHFGMMQAVGIPPHAVLCHRDDGPLVIRNRSGNRHLAGGCRGGGLLQKAGHDIGAFAGLSIPPLVAQPGACRQSDELHAAAFAGNTGTMTQKPAFTTWRVRRAGARRQTYCPCRCMFASRRRGAHCRGSRDSEW